MLQHLTRSIRVRLGWLIALAYLFCVLAPGAALALGTAPAPCLSDELHVVPVPVAHMHADRTSHDHGGIHAHHHADAAGVPTKHGHDGKSSPGPCCAMTCATALPADLPMLVKPSQPMSVCISEAYRSVRGKAPPLLYRPPIAWT